MTDDGNNSVQGDDPEDWAAGNDPMTDAQRVYMDTLAGQAGEPSPGDDLSKAQAAEKIVELREKTGLDTEANA